MKIWSRVYLYLNVHFDFLRYWKDYVNIIFTHIKISVNFTKKKDEIFRSYYILSKGLFSFFCRHYCGFLSVKDVI